MSYKVKLEIFEGPLDLLLYLIKKDDINIYDIPIAKITAEYLDYLEVMKMLDLDIAGDFILMAATLMHIKSKMLLPPTPGELEDLEEEDPRNELVRRLLEYKKFKEAAMQLGEKEAKQREFFKRIVTEEPIIDDGENPFFEVSVFDLITAFTKILKDIPKDTFYKVIKDEFTVSEKMHDILHLVVNKELVLFTDLFKNAKNKFEIVTIFLAILELTRLKEIVFKQSEIFGEIEIYRNIDFMKPQNKENKEGHVNGN